MIQTGLRSVFIRNNSARLGYDGDLDEILNPDGRERHNPVVAEEPLLIPGFDYSGMATRTPLLNESASRDETEPPLLIPRLDFS